MEKMEILLNCTNERQGNDCLIAESISLIRVTYRFYIVIHATQVIGGWTGNPVETKHSNFNSYDEAKMYFGQLCNEHIK